jgi:hypothetical protein
VVACLERLTTTTAAASATSGQGTRAGDLEHPQRLPLAALSCGRQVLAAERLPAGQERWEPALTSPVEPCAEDCVMATPWSRYSR